MTLGRSSLSPEPELEPSPTCPVGMARHIIGLFPTRRRDLLGGTRCRSTDRISSLTKITDQFLLSQHYSPS